MRRAFILILIFLPYLATAESKVDINTAALEQLDTITRIGPAIAQRIIDARPFSSVDELIKVEGIGEKTLQEIKEQGLAYASLEKVEARPQPSAPPEQVAEIGPASPKLQQGELPQINYPDKIFFVEIMPSPAGPDEEGEYIKIKNENGFEISLSGWTIRDTAGSSVNYTFPEKYKIQAQKSATITRAQSKITLNNSGDKLELLNPNQEVIDSAEYGKAQETAYIKGADGWQWQQMPEARPQAITATQKKTEEKSLAQARLPKNEVINLADSASKKSPIITAFITALALAGSFLYLKNRIISN